MIIATGKLNQTTLAGKIALVTGAGGGIGYEACRSLIWLGARTVIAEINKPNGLESVRRLNAEFGPDSAFFVQTELAKSAALTISNSRRSAIMARWISSLTTPRLPVWGRSRISPSMPGNQLPGQPPRAGASGTRFPARHARSQIRVFVCVSSLGTAYMGAYEAMKAAQVHLGATLDAELENSGVSAFTIGPGFVPTQTALSAVPQLAAMMGISLDELNVVLKEQTISVEAAGAGFAAAVALAEQFKGQETASMPTLIAAGIQVPKDRRADQIAYTQDDCEQIRTLACQVQKVLAEQSAGWKQRSIFEQQWLIRGFKKKAGMTVDEWLQNFDRLQQAAAAGSSDNLAAIHAPLGLLTGYYGYMAEMGKGYIKDPIEREKNLAIVHAWQSDAEILARLLKNNYPLLLANFW